jgi:hypothetical protein
MKDRAAKEPIGIIGAITLVREIANYEHTEDIRNHARDIFERARELCGERLIADLQNIEHHLRVAADRYNGNVYDLKQLEHSQAKPLIETFERQAERTLAMADALNEL